MTHCTVCGIAMRGSDDDDDAFCLPCLTANLSGADRRPLRWHWRDDPRPLSVPWPSRTRPNRRPR